MFGIKIFLQKRRIKSKLVGPAVGIAREVVAANDNWPGSVSSSGGESEIEGVQLEQTADPRIEPTTTEEAVPKNYMRPEHCAFRKYSRLIPQGFMTFDVRVQIPACREK